MKVHYTSEQITSDEVGAACGRVFERRASQPLRARPYATDDLLAVTCTICLRVLEYAAECRVKHAREELSRVATHRFRVRARSAATKKQRQALLRRSRALKGERMLRSGKSESRSMAGGTHTLKPQEHSDGT